MVTLDIFVEVKWDSVIMNFVQFLVLIEWIFHHWQAPFQPYVTIGNIQGRHNLMQFIYKKSYLFFLVQLLLALPSFTSKGAYVNKPKVEVISLKVSQAQKPSWKKGVYQNKKIDQKEIFYTSFLEYENRTPTSYIFLVKRSFSTSTFFTFKSPYYFVFSGTSPPFFA